MNVSFSLPPSLSLANWIAEAILERVTYHILDTFMILVYGVNLTTNHQIFNLIFEFRSFKTLTERTINCFKLNMVCQCYF